LRRVSCPPLTASVPSIRLDHPYAPKEPLDRALRLPHVDDFAFGPLSAPESCHEPSSSLDTPPPIEVEDDHLWQAALELGPANKDRPFSVWEAFEGASHVERQTVYITELGPGPLDAALTKDKTQTAAGSPVHGNVLLESLWNLGLGRSSILFSFNGKKRSFEPSVSGLRTSGLGLGVTQSIAIHFTHTGNTFLYLRSFVERTFTSTHSIPARVALATSVSTILSAFEDYLARQSASIRSLLELQRLFAKPKEILDYIARMVNAVKYATTNEQLSSILHHRALEMEESDDNIRQLSGEILYTVAKPSLDLCGEWVGLEEEQQTAPFHERGSFVAIDGSSEPQGCSGYVYHPTSMPSYINTEDGNTIFETGNSLRFLRLHHPEHPLVAPRKFDVDPPALEWKFGWQDIETISQKAKVYENELRTAILNFLPSRSPTGLEVGSTTLATPEDVVGGTNFTQYFENSTKVFDSLPRSLLFIPPGKLQSIIEKILTSSAPTTPTVASMFSPPLPLASTFSFRPLLTVQAKLVNATTLRLFFRSHQLRLHLSLQRQYQLFGDGVYSTRLTSALFDTERESVERQKGKLRSGVHMGLQLGSRDTWPPASSELRLALMGVLSESYYSSALYRATQTKGVRTVAREEKDELPGQLSFAVRQLTDPEMERVMDPYALYALDFLRLQYVPPSPLNLLITASALEKYDTIFKFLLRLQRMIFIVAHLPRQYSEAASRHFRLEAHHFVTALSAYVFQTGIAEPWELFDSFVTAVERRLAEEDAAGELGTRITEGLASLRTVHEECLDSILFSLLLCRRQRKVMTLIEDVFELILLFAKKQNYDTQVKDTARDLHDRLRGKIKVFLSVCKQLTEKIGYGQGTAKDNTLGRLVILLEIKEYFTVFARVNIDNTI
jgi:hypothetical protein